MASTVCFLLWIKVFYWMRLYSTPAYFISLITKTIYDIRIFTLLVLIITCAFANFFYILNMNTPANPYYASKHKDYEHYSYVTDHLGIPVFNALLSMYMLSLGEFDSATYSKGQDKELAWFFFILSTFLCMTVFFNMLIAIMSETFSGVQSEIEESSLYEQLQLIKDFIWLLDLQKEF